MRLYIGTITHENNRDSYVFTEDINKAFPWETDQKAESYLRWTIACGGTICHSPFTKVSGVCSDFRVEPRPQGGFTISCESDI
jgi:hypothetical protein